MSNSPRRLDGAVAPPRVPGATYRLQFNRDFQLQQAAAIVEYLRQLGVTDLYASPLFQAGPQSTHGYDICNFGEFNPSLGTRAQFDKLSERLRHSGLGLLLDMVPNHMGNDLSNAWWFDVLQHGRCSPYSRFFDIDWEPLKSDLHNKVLLPILEDQYRAVLYSGKLRLVWEQDQLAIAYHESRFPVAPQSYRLVLQAVATELQRRPSDPALDRQVAEFNEDLVKSTASGEVGPDLTRRIQAQMRSWAKASPGFTEALRAVCERFGGQPEHPASFDQLDCLLKEQWYRLAFWRVGSEEINYRRFFDVTQLISMRMEFEDVYAAAHRLVFELLGRGEITGLRIDHPDGLWDPKEYFCRLQASYLAISKAAPKDVQAWLQAHLEPLEREERHRVLQHGSGHTLQAPRSDPSAGSEVRGPWPLYVVAEKILTRDEPLRRDWPVEGTTGYEFLSRLNGLFVQTSNADRFDTLYCSFTGNEQTFEDMVYEGKKRILRYSLVSELNALTHRLKRTASQARWDSTFSQCRAALMEIIAAFPVYRTYVSERSAAVMPLERCYIEQAVATARNRLLHPDPGLLNFIQDLLLLRVPPELDEQGQRGAREFVMRFQQLTGPVTAKGLEDTAFYNYNRFISLNEVGGDPGYFGLPLEEFHRQNISQAELWPHSLLATATHDTKRGEDVRARLNVLSEIPDDWAAAVERWARLNEDKKQAVDGQSAPDRNDEYLLYQTLVGAWPLTLANRVDLAGAPQVSAAEIGLSHEQLGQFQDRIVAYLQKALKEAKRHTTWTEPNSAYEKAAEGFARTILDPAQSRPFLEDFAQFQRRTAYFGQLNSLSQVLIKATAPGVPDFYQGTELWDLSLVDPDNRRPVDYELRRRLLQELSQIGQDQPDRLGLLLQHLVANSHTGQIKMFVIARALALRRAHPDLFANGGYIPVSITGRHREHICAFARVHGGRAVLTVAPRLPALMTGRGLQLPTGAVWDDTALELAAAQLPERYTNYLSARGVSAQEGRLPIRAVLNDFPVALLTSE